MDFRLWFADPGDRCGGGRGVARGNPAGVAQGIGVDFIGTPRCADVQPGMGRSSQRRVFAPQSRNRKRGLGEIPSARESQDGGNHHRHSRRRCHNIFLDDGGQSGKVSRI